MAFTFLSRANANNLTSLALEELGIRNYKISKEMYRLSRQAAL